MSKFARAVLSLLALASLTEAANQVHQLQMQDAQIYAIDDNNYAINAAEFNQIGWKTVSVNRGISVAITPNCQQIQRPMNSLTDQEKSLMSARRSQLKSIMSGQSIQIPAGGYSSASFELSAPARNFDNNNSGGQNVITSLSFMNDNDFSISKANLPNNLARVTVYGETVVFFTRDSQIHMKPIACLHNDEQQLVQQLRTEAKQAAQQINQQMQQSQQQTQHNMQHFNQQMQQFGHQMQQQMPNQSWMPWTPQNGIFGPNNPSNGQNGYMSQFGNNQLQRLGWQQYQARPPMQPNSFPGPNMNNFMGPQMQPYQYGPNQGSHSTPGANGGAPGGLIGWPSGGMNSLLGAGLTLNL